MTQLLKYPGGKVRLADWIISYFPTHKVYLEPFFGGGGVFFNKRPADIETINDLNGDIVNLFRVCRERPAELAAAIELTPWARDEFRACYDIQCGDELERARRTLVRYHQSFGTCNSSPNSWRHVQTTGPRVCFQWNELPQTIMQVFSRLKEAQIENMDALTLIERYNHPDTLIYLDPPYIQSTRKRNLYKCEMTDKQHVELLQLIMQSKSKICLSAYDNELYNDYLKDWYTAEKKTTAQMGLPRTEKLYMNYAPDLFGLI